MGSTYKTRREDDALGMEGGAKAVDCGVSTTQRSVVANMVLVRFPMVAEKSVGGGARCKRAIYLSSQ